VTDRRHGLAHLTGGRGVEWVLLALDRSPSARVCGEVALRHEPPHPHRVPGRQEVVRALGPQTVGQREIAIQVTHVQRLFDRGQLMDDHVRPRPRDGLRDLIGIKRIRDHRHSAELAEHRLL
jgi:hypothetical protein